ncbi:hypothetical protein F5050DRAFT_1715191 [Lentinula boryana]|uniref:Zn(2)-C6 fungal-type domain-containing protein n=1 Tax=Lentinula boryana TaxID=40481 RepID=A0ABQ8Q287_9AGAR|nr:hypothetical protein F5050DRAFT_1715191 [Lentinula boryana]
MSSNSRSNTPSDEEEKAELLLIQKQKEERARLDAERKAMEEAAEARLAEIRRKKEEKKREAEERKKKEEIERQEKSRGGIEGCRGSEEKNRGSSRENRDDRRMSTVALVRAQIEQKEKEKLIHSLVSEASTAVVGKKRKRIVIVAVPSGEPEDGDPNPRDDGDYNDSDDEDDDDPPSPPPKQSRCSRCILKALKCEMVGPGSASCKGCRKAKVRCSLVPDNYPRRSKRVKMESPVASTSSRTIDNLRTNVRDLNTRISLQEEMLRYLVIRVRKLEEEKREEEEEEESEEHREKRTGDRKGKGQKE